MKWTSELLYRCNSILGATTMKTTLTMILTAAMAGSRLNLAHAADVPLPT